MVPDEPFTFGRSRACTACLDPDDRGISRVAGSVEAGLGPESPSAEATAAGAACTRPGRLDLSLRWPRDAEWADHDVDHFGDHRSLLQLCQPDSTVELDLHAARTFHPGPGFLLASQGVVGALCLPGRNYTRVIRSRRYQPFGNSLTSTGTTTRNPSSGTRRPRRSSPKLAAAESPWTVGPIRDGPLWLEASRPAAHRTMSTATRPAPT